MKYRGDERYYMNKEAIDMYMRLEEKLDDSKMVIKLQHAVIAALSFSCVLLLFWG